MRNPREFDKEFYDRYYRGRRTRVTTKRQVRLLGAFVCAYLRLLGQPVRRVLDIGCGLGYWADVIAHEFPRARFTGVEVSDYLCKKYGWTPGSVVDFAGRGAYDLVVCQDVMQYLPDRDVTAALANLKRLCRGAVYLDLITAEDWTQSCDRRYSDGKCHRRPASWYRRRIHRHFLNLGGGVFLPKDSPLVTFELQKTGVRA